MRFWNAALLLVWLASAGYAGQVLAQAPLAERMSQALESGSAPPKAAAPKKAKASAKSKSRSKTAPAKPKRKRRSTTKPRSRKGRTTKPAPPAATSGTSKASSEPARGDPAVVNPPKAAAPSSPPASPAAQSVAAAPPVDPAAPSGAAPLPPAAGADSGAALAVPEPARTALAGSEGAGSESEGTEPGAPAASPGGAPLQLEMFVDAYAALQTGGNGTLATLSGHRAFSGQGSTFRSENGFGLAFVGLDLTYDAGSFAATAHLRLGEAAPLYHAQADADDDFSFGIDLLTQAYLTWRPTEPLSFDVGMFTTPFGAEMLESWRNLNYTRGALYYYAQPAWHTGLRARWEASRLVNLTAFVANGTNNISETQQHAGLDQSPSFGAQFNVTPWESLCLSFGGLVAANGYDNDDAGFDGLADFIASLELGNSSAIFNADYVLTRNGAPGGADRQFLGFSLAAGYAFSPSFGLALRGEYLKDDANFDGNADDWALVTATLTADYKPIAEAPQLIVRWDNRWEKSNQDIFGKDAGGTGDSADDTYTDVWLESVIGIVVTTEP